MAAPAGTGTRPASVAVAVPSPQSSTLNAAQLDEANKTVEVVYELSSVLQTGLDRETLSILISLIESGVNPEALAAVVKELRREASHIRVATGEPTGGTASTTTERRGKREKEENVARCTRSV